MNFLGHVRVALWWSEDLRFVLGAMLPDLANMVTAPMPLLVDASLEQGVRLHHRTDRVFHATSTFNRLCRLATRHLLAMGLGRGSARAAAHVGVELLLDRAFAESRPVLETATAAFALASREPGAGLTWADDATRGRFGRLAERLAGRDLAGRDGAPEAVAWRVGRALAGRKRLELSAASQDRLAAWASVAQDSVRFARGELLEEVAEGLGNSALAAR